MRIALDYDDTFTRDDILWKWFVDKLIERGHSVSFVTSRSAGSGNNDIEGDAQLLGIDIVYCEGEPKANHFKADVWIDDCPLMIPSYDVLRAALLGDS